MTTRRDFVIGAGSAGVWPLLPARAAENWDQGRLAHLLPTVSHDRILIKASFTAPLAGAPALDLGGALVRGEKTSPLGDFWQFDAANLKPQTRKPASRTIGARVRESAVNALLL